jgi:hypothetical protein
MTLDEAIKIEKALLDSRPNPEDYDFGPAFEMAVIYHKDAIKIIRKYIKRLKK